jgi:hypothetical protein
LVTTTNRSTTLTLGTDVFIGVYAHGTLRKQLGDSYIMSTSTKLREAYAKVYLYKERKARATDVVEIDGEFKAVTIYVWFNRTLGIPEGKLVESTDVLSSLQSKIIYNHK